MHSRFDILMYFLLAANCTETATWQQENASATFCDTHKQQMPPFMSFLPLESMQGSKVERCANSYDHGSATMYCGKCKQSLCIDCAHDHVIHDAVDMAKQSATTLNMLEAQTKESLPIVDDVRKKVATMQLVCKKNMNSYQ